jgi:probable F420-dependent oxidoreductase
VQFAISIPQSARGSVFDEAPFRAYLRRVDELDQFESAWVQEQVIGSSGSLAPLETLTFAAACTERVRLGCAVFVLPLHNPLHLAKAISSLDCLSHGRVEVGVASGGQWRPFEAFGVDPDKPVARFNEALALMKAFWTEPEINFDGRLWKLKGASMEPKPVQKPYPPIWIGGSGERKTLRVVAQHADVWNAPGGEPGEVQRLSGVLDRHCADVGRDPVEIRRSVQFRFDGDTETALRTVQSYVAVGIDDVIVMLMGGRAQEHAEQAADLLPRLKELG